MSQIILTLLLSFISHLTCSTYCTNFPTNLFPPISLVYLYVSLNLLAHSWLFLIIYISSVFFNSPPFKFLVINSISFPVSTTTYMYILFFFYYFCTCTVFHTIFFIFSKSSMNTGIANCILLWLYCTFSLTGSNLFPLLLVPSVV